MHEKAASPQTLVPGRFILTFLLRGAAGDSHLPAQRRARGKPVERRCGNMDVRDYELMYIVRPTVPEDQVGTVTERVGTFITGLGGEVAETNPWGKRRLAYPIEDHEDGYYVVSKVKMASGRTQELENQLRISEDVIRHILVRPGE